MAEPLSNKARLKRPRLVFRSANIKRVVLALTGVGLVFAIIQQYQNVSNILGVPPIIMLTLIAIVVLYYSKDDDEAIG